MPLNVIAGIGGMSEFSMMTADVPWPMAYGVLSAAMVVMGLITYQALRYRERHKVKAKKVGAGETA